MDTIHHRFRISGVINFQLGHGEQRVHANQGVLLQSMATQSQPPGRMQRSRSQTTTSWTMQIAGLYSGK